MSNKRAMPTDFPTRALTDHKGALGRRYAASSDAIARWFREANMTPVPPPSMRTPIPPDFGEVAHLRTKNGHACYYGVTHGVVHRWVAELGVTVSPDTPETRRQRALMNLARVHADDDDAETHMLPVSRHRWIEEVAPVIQALAYRCPDHEVA